VVVGERGGRRQRLSVSPRSDSREARNIFELQIAFPLSFGWEIAAGSKLIVTQRFDSTAEVRSRFYDRKLGHRNMNSPADAPLKTRAHPPHTSHTLSSVRSTTKRYLSESPKAIDSDNDDVSSLTFLPLLQERAIN
jgi:hypothetical protein